MSSVDMSEWITLREATRLHPHLNIKWLRRWMDLGLTAGDENHTRIYLKPRRLGGRVYTTEADVLEFLAALEPEGADEEVIRRLSR